MIEYSRPYDGRDDGANPGPGEASWQLPFDNVLEFHKTDAAGEDAAAILSALRTGDQILYGPATFNVVLVAPVQNRYRVTVEAHDPPISTAPELVTFRRWSTDPEPAPQVVGRRPWRAEVSIR